ncbi:hypothetical protein B566_EDAN003765 [Ephemera danica]|nr:hypothetical protein B566_EDAN003765 [Ephemera danica]
MSRVPLPLRGVTGRNGGGSIPTLFSMAIRTFLSHLERSVELIAHRKHLGLSTINLLKDGQECRDFLAPLPARLRQEMLDQVLASGRVYNTVDMMLLEVLLYSDIRHLSVRHVRKWYRGRFLHLLKEHGTGLYTLHLEEIRVSPDCDISLSSCLSSLKLLTSISLRFDCDDTVMWALGRSCPNLEHLDVEGSIQVTDLGVQTLCLRGATLPAASFSTTTAEEKDGLVSALYSFIERCLCIPQTMPLTEDAVVGLSWWRSSLMRRARKNPCCNTLLVINVRSTRVTAAKGLNLLKSCCIKAEILSSKQNE